MARQIFLTASTGWDERTQAPLCSVTLYYDDVTLIMAEAEVVNGSDDTVATFAVEDTTKAAKDPTRLVSRDVASKLTTKTIQAITPVQLVQVAGAKKGDPVRIEPPPGFSFSFNGSVYKIAPTNTAMTKAGS